MFILMILNIGAERLKGDVYLDDLWVCGGERECRYRRLVLVKVHAGQTGGALTASVHGNQPGVDIVVNEG